MKHQSLAPNPNAFSAPIAEMIWDSKYRYKDPDTIGADGAVIPGEIHDKSVEDTWMRIANALASVEENPERWVAPFYSALEDFKFLPAGRITAGAGTGRNVTLFNCFVMGEIPDSMAGIFDMLKEAALTMQQGGGIGYDFSTLRPRGEQVKGVGSDASGPLSFMDVWDAMCRTIMSAGSRRGAMMATMRCDHPDIEDFITAKQDSARLRMFNLSVLITDAFMEAVKADGDWDLVWNGEVKKTLRARALWDLIMRSTYDYAEPGVIFIDRVNEQNPLHYIEQISCSNPCGEQMLPPYGACLLGSLNLARLVENPFTDKAGISDEALDEIVTVAMRMLDNVIDLSRFALEAQRKEAMDKRRVGLGVTGVADALLMLGLTYGSEEAAEQVKTWLRRIANAAARASVDLAREKGAFPLFDAEQYLASPTIAKLDEDVKAGIREHGIRNALQTSIAPTGTISLYAGNVSSGIEPVFAYSYFRKVLQPDGSKIEEEVVDYAVQMYRQMFGITDDADLPEYFVSALTLSPLDHVRMQAAAQEWIDSSISKTINCPEDISFEEFKDVYVAAFESGCKGCTTYRPNDVTGSVLSTESSASKSDLPAVSSTPASPMFMAEPMKRERTLEGHTYKLKWPDAAHPFYITINSSVDETGRKRPFEIFINTQNVEAQAWITAWTRMISAVFRRGGDVSFVAKEMKDVFDPRGGAWMDGSYVNSLIAAIGGIIEEDMQRIGFIEAPGSKAATEGETCPSCGERTMVQMSGCATCTSCGYSKCS